MTRLPPLNNETPRTAMAGDKGMPLERVASPHARHPFHVGFQVPPPPTPSILCPQTSQTTRQPTPPVGAASFGSTGGSPFVKQHNSTSLLVDPSFENIRFEGNPRPGSPHRQNSSRCGLFRAGILTPPPPDGPCLHLRLLKVQIPPPIRPAGPCSKLLPSAFSPSIPSTVTGQFYPLQPLHRPRSLQPCLPQPPRKVWSLLWPAARATRDL